MNITELNERIAQLTDLVSNAEETIKSANEMIKLAVQERDRLADQRRESEPKFERVDRYNPYWTLIFDGAACIEECRERGVNCYSDNENFESNNYFKTEERAQEVADKINFLLKLERLHDTFCPEYVPDWNDFNERKYIVFYNGNKKQYDINSFNSIRYVSSVYFSSLEIAKKVCGILNAELEEHYES